MSLAGFEPEIPRKLVNIQKRECAIVIVKLIVGENSQPAAD